MSSGLMVPKLCQSLLVAFIISMYFMVRSSWMLPRPFDAFRGTSEPTRPSRHPSEKNSRGLGRGGAEPLQRAGAAGHAHGAAVVAEAVAVILAGGPIRLPGDAPGRGGVAPAGVAVQ